MCFKTAYVLKIKKKLYLGISAHGSNSSKEKLRQKTTNLRPAWIYKVRYKKRKQNNNKWQQKKKKTTCKSCKYLITLKV